MKLKRLEVGECCNHSLAVKAGEPVDTHYLTETELQKVIEVYNAVADVAEGSNNLPHQITFRLLRDEEVVSPVVDRGWETLDGR